MAYIIAYDLGTGGNKAALYDHAGRCLAESIVAYPTYYPHTGWHEQRPADWWDAVVESSRQLIAQSGVKPSEIVCCGMAGQSLGVVPIGKHGQLLRPFTPIWSDARAGAQAAQFFQRIPETEWYRITGNGFPPALYSVFKMMWYQEHEPELFGQIAKIIGSKDYINFRLTGYLGTDYSYASGAGVYDLFKWGYSDQLLSASQLPTSIFPEIVPSTQVIGTLQREAAEALGLSPGTRVVAGGVDNSCMALGARNTQEGRVYNSQGSSSWIAVTSSKPLIEERLRPFVFAHVMPGLFTSAVSIFSAGASFRWVRDNLCADLKQKAALENLDVYDLMTAEAMQSPVGARGVLFNPNLAGGASMSLSPRIRGGYLNLDLSHARADLIRAAMEGIALELRGALDGLRRLQTLQDEMLVVGGGSRSLYWQQIYADVYNMKIVRTNINQQAAALGAAACAAVGAGLWPDFDRLESIHHVQDIIYPVQENVLCYEKILPAYLQASQYLSSLGDFVYTQ